MPLHNAAGERLYRRVTFKVFNPGNGSARTFILKPRQGDGFTGKGIELLLAQFAEHLERDQAQHDFRLAAIAPNAFNFIWLGLKSADAAEKYATRESFSRPPTAADVALPAAAG